MNNQDFIGMCPTCEKICKQVGRETGWWQCGNCTWMWEPQDKQDLTDRIKGEKMNYRLEDTAYANLIPITEKETVNHPAHYGKGTYETINVIEAWDLGFNLGNAVKYISRAGKKGDRQEDLKKALWYLERELGRAKD